MPGKIRKTNVKIKRVYEPSESSDGMRILVDRLWPRGLSKRKAAIDEWIREVAPSTALRKWFGHDPGRWPQFRTRYRAELKRNPEPLKRLRTLTRQQRSVTLVYAAHDEAHNNAVVLRSLLRR